jgi:hypothetical protein
MCFALDSVKLSFENFFGKEYVNQFELSVLPGPTPPVTFSQQRVIFLTARGLRWSQLIYQFSHELCHFMINADVVGPMRWFEESICELASFFFLQHVSMDWASRPHPDIFKIYAIHLIEYRDTQMNEQEPVDCGKTFAQHIADRIELLSHNPYMRHTNTLCATELLPIFIEHPAVWRDVPLLAKIPDGLPFDCSLDFWLSVSSCKEAVEKIISAFSL